MTFIINLVFYKFYDTFYKNNNWSFMNYNKLLKFSSLCLSLSIVSCGVLNDSETHHSKAKTVEVAQTEVRDQGKVGFCWAYATTAFVEAKHLKETGEALTISPEALGFYRMAIGLYQATRAKSAQDLMALVMPGGLEGYFVKLPDGGSDALTIINQFGLVPESQWSFKFIGDGQSEKMMAAMRGGLWVVVRDRLLRGRDASDLTLDELIEKVMTVRGAYPSRPPTQFEWNGQTISSQSFARDIVSFKSEDYYSLEVNSSSDLNKMIHVAVIKGHKCTQGCWGLKKPNILSVSGHPKSDIEQPFCVRVAFKNSPGQAISTAGKNTRPVFVEKVCDKSTLVIPFRALP
jgi:hypothetical protein